MKQIWEKIKAMARPKIIRNKDGVEVTLKNATPEIVAAVEAAVNGGTRPTELGEEEPEVVNRTGDATLEGSPLTSGAVGVYQHPLTLDWHVVTLKFSPISKRGEVTGDVVAGKDREMVRERFKIQVVKEGLMG